MKRQHVSFKAPVLLRMDGLKAKALFASFFRKWVRRHFKGSAIGDVYRSRDLPNEGGPLTVWGCDVLGTEFLPNTETLSLSFMTTRYTYWQQVGFNRENGTMDAIALDRTTPAITLNIWSSNYQHLPKARKAMERYRKMLSRLIAHEALRTAKKTKARAEDLPPLLDVVLDDADDKVLSVNAALAELDRLVAVYRPVKKEKEKSARAPRRTVAKKLGSTPLTPAQRKENVAWVKKNARKEVKLPKLKKAPRPRPAAKAVTAKPVEVKPEPRFYTYPDRRPVY